MPMQTHSYLETCTVGSMHHSALKGFQNQQRKDTLGHRQSDQDGVQQSARAGAQLCAGDLVCMSLPRKAGVVG